MMKTSKIKVLLLLLIILLLTLLPTSCRTSAKEISSEEILSGKSANDNDIKVNSISQPTDKHIQKSKAAEENILHNEYQPRSPKDSAAETEFKPEAAVDPTSESDPQLELSLLSEPKSKPVSEPLPQAELKADLESKPEAESGLVTQSTKDDSQASQLISGISPYLIYVEKGAHTLTVYSKDPQGYYTQPVITFLTASGRTAGRTPTGTFKIGAKERWHKFGSGLYTQYASSYHNRLYIHGPLYKKTDIHTLYPDSYHEIGTNSSAGCLRTTTEAAYWVYENCPKGTIVQIVNGSPKNTSASPLPKIDLEYPNTDPTDPNHPKLLSTP